jgi:methylated-DNA-[protein]-cysteine S-methyltransferase
MKVPYAVIETRLGWAGLVATSGGIVRCVLPKSTRDGALRELEVPTDILSRLVEPPQDAVDLISAYFRGDPVDLTVIPLDLTGVTPFALRVFDVLLTIGRGQVMSYKQVAGRVGNPKAARAVGGAVGQNPVAPVIPCHRVVGTGGDMVGFSCEGGLALKRRLLLMEGVAFRGDRVDPGILHADTLDP